MRGISLCKDEETENLLRKEEKTTPFESLFALFRSLDREWETKRLKVFKIAKIRNGGHGLVTYIFS